MLSERQAQIIQVSIKIISEKGIQGFTIKNLSREIGISEPAIYRHFDGKTEILTAILDQFKNFDKEITASILTIETDSLQKIRMIFDRLFSKFSQNPSLVSVIFADEIFKNEPVLATKIAEIMKNNELMFISLIKKGQESNEIRTDINIKYLVLMIMGALRLLVKKWELSKYNFNLHTEGEKLFWALNSAINKN